MGRGVQRNRGGEGSGLGDWPTQLISVFDILYLVFVVWYLSFGICYLSFGTLYLPFGTLYLSFGIWCSFAHYQRPPGVYTPICQGSASINLNIFEHFLYLVRTDSI